MLSILVAAGVATAGAIAWYKVLLPVDRMLELSDELSENEWRPAPRSAPSECSTGLANLAAATGTTSQAPLTASAAHDVRTEEDTRVTPA